MKLFGKVLSIALTLALILSAVPAVFAAETPEAAGGMYEYRNTFDSAASLDDFDVYWVASTAAGTTVVPETDKTAHLSVANGKVQRVNDLAALGNQTSLVLKDYEFENFEVVLEYVDGDSWGWTTLGFRQDIAGSYAIAGDGAFAYIDTAGQAWAWGENGLYFGSWNPQYLPGYGKGTAMTMTVRLVGNQLTVTGKCGDGAATEMYSIDVSAAAGGKQLSFNFVGDNSAIDAITVKRLDASGKQIPVKEAPAPAANESTYVNDFAAAEDLDDFDVYWVASTASGEGKTVVLETDKTAHLSVANGKVQRVNDLSALGNQTSLVLKDYNFENFEAVIHYTDGDSWGWTTLGFRQDIAGSYAISGDGAFAYIDTAGQAWAWGENGLYFGSYDPAYLPGYVKGAPMTMTVRLVGDQLTVTGKCGDGAATEMYSIDVSAAQGDSKLSFNFVGDNSAIDWISVTRLNEYGDVIPLADAPKLENSDQLYVNYFDSADALKDFDATFAATGALGTEAVAESTDAHWTLANGCLERINDINAVGATSNVAVLTFNKYQFDNFEATLTYRDGRTNWGWTGLGLHQEKGNFFVLDGAGAYIDVAGQAHLWGSTAVGGPHDGDVMAKYGQGKQLTLKVRVVGNNVKIYGNGTLLLEKTVDAAFDVSAALSIQSVGNDSKIQCFTVQRLDDAGNVIDLELPEPTPEPGPETGDGAPLLAVAVAVMALAVLCFAARRRAVQA